jgi:hypothetical protein
VESRNRNLHGSKYIEDISKHGSKADGNQHWSSPKGKHHQRRRQECSKEEITIKKLSTDRSLCISQRFVRVLIGG